MHSPTPWKVVRSDTPYATWLCDAEGGCVALAFGFTDEAVLLNAPIYLHAIEDAIVALDAGRIVAVRRILAAALAAE